MAKVTFKQGSNPYLLNAHFAQGKSLTYDEAYQMGIRHLTQRIADLKKKFDEAGAHNILMVIDEQNERGGMHARYFYKGSGCLLETKSGARFY